MNKGFPEEIKEAIVKMQNGYCKRCSNPIHSIHHKLHNTKYNRKKFPLFINSPMNGVGLCFNCHTNHHHEFNISDKEAEVYEMWLEKLRDGEI